MNCNEARDCLSAHLDEELDVIRDAEMVAHLNTCPACAQSALAHAARRGLIREQATRFAAPATLAAQIRAALPASAAPASARVRRHLWTWSLPLAASLAVAAFVGYQSGVRTTRARDLAVALTSSHVRSVMSGHPVDVESTDRHTVKPWFVGKLDFSPPVVDLAAEGFPLVGGRIDQLEGRRVAVLVYQRRQHRIDVYLELANAGPSAGSTVNGGFNIVSWTHGEFRALAISDLAVDELKSFTELWQNRAP